MKLRVLSTLKRTALVLTMATAGLSVAAQAVPAAHAATTLITPTITTSVTYLPVGSGSPGGAILNVRGVNFTPSGLVKVEVLDHSLHVIRSRIIRASVQLKCVFPPARPPICTRIGVFGQGFVFIPLPAPQILHVIAFDFGTGRFSNFATQPIA